MGSRSDKDGKETGNRWEEDGKKIDGRWVKDGKKIDDRWVKGSRWGDGDYETEITRQTLYGTEDEAIWDRNGQERWEDGTKTVETGQKRRRVWSL